MSARPRCPTCGKLLRPWTVTVFAPRLPDKWVPVPDWHYSGNHEVVAKRYAHLLVSPDGTSFKRQNDWNADWPDFADWRKETRLEAVYTWDGESYASASRPFCKPECATRFARAAHRAGYRLDQSVPSTPVGA